MKYFIAVLLLFSGPSLVAQLAEYNHELSSQEAADYALLSSLEWLFSTNNNYHCKVENKSTTKETQNMPDANAADLKRIGKFNVFPNPTKDGFINLELELNNTLPASIIVSDLNGTEIERITVPGQSGAFTYQISSQQLRLSTAIIIVSVVQGNSIESRKIVLDTHF